MASMGFFLGILLTSTSHATPVEPPAASHFIALVQSDADITPGQRDYWQSIQRHFLHRTEYDFDYAPLLHTLLRASLDGKYILAESIVAANTCLIAVSQGADLATVETLAPLVLSRRPDVRQLQSWARSMRHYQGRGVPENIAMDILAHGHALDWSQGEIDNFLFGIAAMAALGVDADLATLYLHFRESQHGGAVSEFVAQALERMPPSLVGSASERADFGPLWTAFRSLLKPWLGAPYRWGGESPDGADCSGFTKVVMDQMGKKAPDECELPRVSRHQALAGSKVAATALEPGDLVFFDMKHTGRIDHVGLYLGADLMAHASATRGVIIVPLSSPYFQARFVTARRVLSAQSVQSQEPEANAAKTSRDRTDTLRTAAHDPS
jgi:hypothetical protein